jgi:Bacterial mobilisation protein (MobC).
MIRERMARVGVTSMGAYMRKMAIDGYFLNIDLSDVRTLVSLLRRCSNNLNQYARRANEVGSIYAADIEDARSRLDEIWDKSNEIIAKLSKIVNSS